MRVCLIGAPFDYRVLTVRDPPPPFVSALWPQDMHLALTRDEIPPIEPLPIVRYRQNRIVSEWGKEFFVYSSGDKLPQDYHVAPVVELLMQDRITELEREVVRLKYKLEQREFKESP